LGDGKSGIYDGAKMTSFSCCVWDDQGICWTGGANSLVYKWGPDRKCMGTVNVHGKGFVCAITFGRETLFSGGKDGFIHDIDRKTMSSRRKWSLDTLIRSIDVASVGILAGCRNGNIMELKHQEGQVNKCFMSSHCDGEVWGLEMHDGKIITSGDDD
jgi:hypothetical protein